MRDFWTMMKTLFAAVGAWLGYFLGGNDGLPVPEQLKQVLEQLHDRAKKSGEPDTVDDDMEE